MEAAEKCERICEKKRWSHNLNYWKSSILFKEIKIRIQDYLKSFTTDFGIIYAA